MYGDCERAAYATILDLPYEAVPHFWDGGVQWKVASSRIRAFLATRGMSPVHLLYPGMIRPEKVFAAIEVMNPGLTYLFSGKSAYKHRPGVDAGHIVVAGRGKILHDPSPNATGIVGPAADGFYWVTILTPLSMVIDPTTDTEG